MAKLLTAHSIARFLPRWSGA